MLLINFALIKWNYQVSFCKIVAFITRAKIEEYMLIVMDKSSHDENLSQPIQTNIKYFNKAVTVLTGYIDIFKVPN